MKQRRLSRRNLNLVMGRAITGKLRISSTVLHLKHCPWIHLFVWHLFFECCCSKRFFWQDCCQHLSCHGRNSCFSASIFSNPTFMLLITCFLSLTRNDSYSVGLSLHLYYLLPWYCSLEGRKQLMLTPLSMGSSGEELIQKLVHIQRKGLFVSKETENPDCSTAKAVYFSC